MAAQRENKHPHLETNLGESESYSQQDAERDLPELEVWSDKLMKMAKGVMESDSLRLTKEPFRLFCLAFLTRQFDHVGSLVALHGHRDMTLIARSMLEGMAILMWVSKDAASRAALWRDFIYVHDWRMYRRHRREGKPVNEEEWNQVLEGLEATGAEFYSPKARDRLSSGETLPADPYRGNWIGKKYYKLFDDIDLMDWYRKFYAPFADWHHWGSASLLNSLSFGDDGVTYSGAREDDTVYALLIGISSLHVTLQLANVELNLEIGPELDEYRVTFEEWHQSRGARWGMPYLAPRS